MSWTDVPSESTRRSPRPSRPSYVPPHLRYNAVPSNDYARRFTTESPAPGRSNYYDTRQPGRATPGYDRGRGRGRGRGRSQWGDSQREFDYSEPNPFEVFDKFDELDVGEEPDDSGINFDAYEDIPVEVTGDNIPPPANTFADIELGRGLNENIKRCRYVKPTPIQRYAIPISLAGRDLMACAQTGSGKTAAFCFPIISGISKSKASQSMSSPVSRDTWLALPAALIISPTRELACQIHDEAKKFAYQTGVQIAVAYGGAPISQQLRNLGKGVDILVATPGRLVDMIDRGRVSLQMIKYLALDEADRMLDMGFEPQIRKIVQRMDMPQPGDRQTMLFSATFPEEIQRLASDFLANYIFLSVGRVGSSTDLISQKVEYVEDMDKRKLLLDLLNAPKSNGMHGKNSLTLVFVETKRGADSLENWLCHNGFLATAIHGDKIQMERERSLKSFKNGSTPVMVATDVASRGLDIPHVSHVINFDLPKSIDDYVHRIGRTGRAGKSGLATAFFNNANVSLAKALVELMLEAKQDVPQFLTECAGNSNDGGSGRYGGNRYGGRDYRNSQSHGSNYYQPSSYGDFGAVGGDYCGNADSYAAAAGNNYGNGDAYGASPGNNYYAASGSGSYSAPSVDFDYSTISPTGWDC